MKKIIIYVFLFVLLIIYYFNRHHIRPYVYKHYDHGMILFLFGVLPNIIGAIALFIIIRYLLLKPVKPTLIFINLYAIWHESMNYYFDDIPFDIYDILATFITSFFMLLLDWKITFCKDIDNKKNVISKLFDLRNNS